MELRALGSTGLKVSALGLGAVKIGRNRGLKYPGAASGAGDAFALPSDDEVLDLLRAAAESGVNLIDTAPAYGTSEARLGAAMHKAAWFGGRDRWVISTKAGEEFDAASGESRFDFSPVGVRASVERSLRRLRVDALDVVMLHSDGRDEFVICDSGGLDELRRLKQEGKIRAIGVSTKTPDGGLMAVRRSIGGCDVVMVTFNPRDRHDEVVIDAARLRGVGVLVKKALMSGHMGEMGALLPPALRELSDPAEAALRFATGKTGVSSVVVGTLNAARLRHNAAILAK